MENKWRGLGLTGKAEEGLGEFTVSVRHPAMVAGTVEVRGCLSDSVRSLVSLTVLTLRHRDRSNWDSGT